MNKQNWIVIAVAAIIFGVSGYFIGKSSSSKTTDMPQMPEVAAESFEGFLEKFENDTAFQLSRIEFPVKDIQLTEDYEHLDTIYTKRENWMPVRFKTDPQFEHASSYQEFDDFGIDSTGHPNPTLMKTDSRVISIGSQSTGSFHYYFKLKDGKWFLVAKVDYSSI